MYRSIAMASFSGTCKGVVCEKGILVPVECGKALHVPKYRGLFHGYAWIAIMGHARMH